MDSLGIRAYTAGMTLGGRIKALREERGWSQRELAKRAGLNSQTLHRIEHGGSSAGWKSRLKIAKAFGIPVAALDPTVAEEPGQHVQARSSSASLVLATLTEQQLLEGIAEFVKELERRQKNPPPSDVPNHRRNADEPPDDSGGNR